MNYQEQKEAHEQAVYDTLSKIVAYSKCCGARVQEISGELWCGKCHKECEICTECLGTGEVDTILSEDEISTIPCPKCQQSKEERDGEMACELARGN